MVKYLLLASLLLNGCSVSLTAQGRMVRIITDRPNCMFVGVFEDSFSMGADIPDDRIQAKKSVMNMIAEAGGNYMVVVDQGGGLFASTVIAEGYYCAR